MPGVWTLHQLQAVDWGMDMLPLRSIFRDGRLRYFNDRTTVHGYLGTR